MSWQAGRQEVHTMQDSQGMQVVHASCNVNETAAHCILQQQLFLSVLAM